MEDVEQIVIPTVSKAKISRDLSYPIGAEGISKQLQEVPQFSLLRLQFHFWSDFGLRHGQYEFLRVEYLKNSKPAQGYQNMPLYSRPPQYQWEIVVQPVPRVFRHQIKQYVLDQALPTIKDWLELRKGYVQSGSDILAFSYSEKLEEFTAVEVSHMDPVRANRKARL